MGETTGTDLNGIISKTESLFWNFYCIFGIYTQFFSFWKKDQLHSLNISEVIDPDRCGYFIARNLLF